MNQCKTMNVEIVKPKDVGHFLGNLEKLRATKKRAANLLFEEIESDVVQKERFVVDQTERLKEMNDSYLTMIDYKNVLQKVGEIIPRIHAGGNDVRASMHGGLAVNTTTQYRTSLNHDEEDRSQKQTLLQADDQNVFITHVAGTIDPLEKERLKKLLFRATRGKALTYFSDFTVRNQKNERVPKSVYIVVFQDGRMMRDRIERICDSFMGQRFDLPPLSQIR